MMNGKISVDSKLGNGSTFTVHLPQKIAGSDILGREMADNLMQLRLIDTAKTRKEQFIREYMPYGRVMIVDDVDSNLFVAKGLMAPYGLSIDTVSSGLSAVNKIKRGEVYDIIFMDHMMPEMDGIEAVKIIREFGYKHSIVALTANALVGQAKVFLENGFDDFIPKPIDIRQLNAVLNRLVRDKQPPEVIDKARMNVQVKAKPPVPATDASLHSIFVQDAKKSLSVFEKTLGNIENATDEDLHLFTINVHAMKSNLANIGEKEASDAAFSLEIAGKNRDRNAIKAKMQNFIDTLQEIVNRVDIKQEAPDDNIEEDTAHLQEQLRIICDACVNYNVRTINEILVNLRKMQWKCKTKILIEQISEHILFSDFEEAKAKVEEFFS
jgi:CheY-like chemotaxis protein/HPt (histidine-containing phosphotransfer) domain-containing protein